MPDSAMSAALREAYAYADESDPIYYTLELRHVAFTEPVRVVLDHVDLRAALEATAPENPGEEVTWTAFACRFDRPAVDDRGRPSITIEVDNVSRTLLPQIQAASASSSPVQITVREYLASDLSGPQNDPPLTMVATSCRADVFTVTMTAVLAGPNADQPFPSWLYTIREFPGLVG